MSKGFSQDLQFIVFTSFSLKEYGKFWEVAEVKFIYFSYNSAYSGLKSVLVFCVVWRRSEGTSDRVCSGGYEELCL